MRKVKSLHNIIIEMKISNYGKLHKQMRKNGIEILHINVKINDFRGF